MARGKRGRGDRGGRQLVVAADNEQGDMGRLSSEPLGGVLERLGDIVGKVVAVGDGWAGLERRGDAALQTRGGRHGIGLGVAVCVVSTNDGENKQGR